MKKIHVFFTATTTNHVNYSEDGFVTLDYENPKIRSVSKEKVAELIQKAKEEAQKKNPNRLILVTGMMKA